jgi:hypothetical protein
MYYQYGLFKPLAVLKAGNRPTLRQLVPAALIVSLVLTLFAGSMPAIGRKPLAAILTLYLAALIAGGASVGRTHGIRVGLAALVVLPAIHLSYGFGYLRGTLELAVGRRSRPRNAIPLTR